jgi:hypothetical protein
MEQGAKARFEAVLSRGVDAHAGVPALDAASAARLLERTANVQFFAHSYTFYHNMVHGFTPHDLARFAYEHDLHGLCLHISDGNSLNVRHMTPPERDKFRRLLEELGLQLHLEISSTDRQEVDTVIECARSLGVRNIRFYARHEGPLSSVITKVFADLAYACDRANDRIQVFQKDGKFVKETFIAKKTLGDGSVWDIAFSRDPQQKYLYMADGKNERIYVLDRMSLEILTTFGDGGRQPGQFFGVHSIATDSKGNIYTTETYEGKRLQKFAYKGIGPVKRDQGAPWPAAD